MAKEKSSAERQQDFFKLLEDKFSAYFEPELIKSRILPFDLALNGGLETGSLIEITGDSQCGKSTLVLHAVKNLAEQGYKTLYIDAEGSVKDDMLAGIGLTKYLTSKDNKDNKIFVIRESAFSAVENLIDSALATGEFKVIVIDSLTALVNDDYITMNEKEKRSGLEERPGLQARLTSAFLRKLNALKTAHNCIFICINQTRTDLSGFMAQQKSTGGKAVEYFPDVRLYMKVKEKINEKRQLLIGEQEVQIGAAGYIMAKKSRLGLGRIPFPITVYFGKGISNIQAYAELLPTIKVDGNKHALEKTSTVTYELNLPTVHEKTSGGKSGLYILIHDYYNQIEEYVDKYLDNYFAELKATLKNNSLPVEAADEMRREVKDDESDLILDTLD